MPLSAAGGVDGLRALAAGCTAADVDEDTLRDLLRLWRTRSQSFTVRLNDADSVG